MQLTVYIVESSNWDEDYIVGVFSSLERAKAYLSPDVNWQESGPPKARYWYDPSLPYGRCLTITGYLVR